MKHKELIDWMTLEEKAAFLSGKNVWETRNIDRLGISSIFCADGPHGIRKQAGAGDHLGLNASLPATCFPTAATVANSWDVSLGEAVGKALGEEASAQKVHVLLGPGLNIKRSPLCGRNFEYFSEDPYLAGKMAAAYIKGIQSQGVYACPKHFAVNSQELRRMAMNSVLDERTLREIYLTGFEIAVKEGGAGAIMTSYNEINGIYANENEHLLLDILRKEWKFEGIVITDWGGSNDHVRAVAARSNLEMPAPGLDSAREVTDAVNNGRLSMAELDICVDDLLDAVLKLTGDTRAEEPKINRSGKTGSAGNGNIDEKAHHNLARRAAAESIILLKNEADPEPLLPLKEKTKVALIGDFAITPRYQGAGSSIVNPTRLDSMKQAVTDYPVTCIGCVQGYRRTGASDDALKKTALDLAALADVVIYCFGLDELSESEGLDRTHMRIPQNQIELLESLVKVNPDIVGILSAGSPIEMPWHYCCKSLLHGYLGGQAGAEAMMEILVGNINSSGKLSETYPLRYEDTPAFRYFPGTHRNSEYRESIFVGYRYYDTGKMRVQYPFGFGLSYTTFEYSNLVVDDTGVEFEIANTGSREGAEVAQLYVSGPKGQIFRPDKELKGFAKVLIPAGENRKVRISFDDKTFRYWNTKTDSWEQEGGDYTILIGASVADVKLTKTISIKGTTEIFPCQQEQMSRYFSGQVQDVPDQEFAELLAHPIPDGRWSGKLGPNDAICQLYYAKSGLGRFVYRVLTRLKKLSEAKGKPDLNILFIYNMPFRGIAKMTGGAVSREMVDGMVLAVNGQVFRGAEKIIRGYFNNKRANKIYEKKLAGK